MRHIAILPVRDEEQYLGRMLDSLLAQTAPPELIVIVNDGSTDGTVDLVRRYQEKSPLIKLIDGPPSTKRNYRVVEVFNRGYELVRDTPSTYVSKLDADLVFPPDYFERVLGVMDADPDVGMAAGVMYEMIHGQETRYRSPQNHVVGPLKTMRRSAFDAMGGFMPVLGWDIIDHVQMRQLGYRTVAFPDLRVLHLRRHASAGGNILRGNMRMGHGAYVIGSHPLFIVGRSIYRMFETPYVTGGLAFGYGYFRSWFANLPRIENRDLIRALRREQLYRLVHFNRLPAHQQPG